MNYCELKAAMARKGISAPKLASALGLSKKTIYERLKGNRGFCQAEICGIAKLLDLSNDQIISIFFDEKVS